MKITFTCSLKIILYFTLFLELENRKQWLNSVINLKK